MPTGRKTDAAERRSWWEQRRGRFSLTVAVGYAATVVLFESFAPWWAGDHIGLSIPSLLAYALGGLVWIAVVNILYRLGSLAERVTRPANLAIYRRRAYMLMITVGAVSSGGWFGMWMIEACLRHH